MKTKKKSTVIFLSLIVLSLTVILSFMFLKTSTTKTLAAEVDTDFANMTKLIDEQVKNDPMLALSSNPYDYIKDNKYYDNIINKGISAVPILEEKLKNSTSDGLEEYIIAIAIEEITQCNLKGDTNTAWQSAKGFSEKWEPFVNSASDEINNILNSKFSIETKISKLNKYGRLAAPYLNKCLDENIENNNFENNKYIEKQLEKLSTSTNEIERIDEYLGEK